MAESCHFDRAKVDLPVGPGTFWRAIPNDRNGWKADARTTGIPSPIRVAKLAKILLQRVGQVT